MYARALFPAARLTGFPMAAKPKRSKKAGKERPNTGLVLVDALESKPRCQIADYVAAASEYVRLHRSIKVGPKKAAQIRLSDALSRILRDDLADLLPEISEARTGEHKVSGALRIANADLSEFHQLDGLRLAVEIKPVNLAVGRAIWNRFGDIRTFAVNLHLKFPFSVIGGVLAIPTYEEKVKKASGKIVEDEPEEPITEEGTETEPDAEQPEVYGDVPVVEQPMEEGAAEASGLEAGDVILRIPTVHLIERVIKRLVRAGGRRSEGDAPHLLEGIGVIVYDPVTGELDPHLPMPGSGLRWDEFVLALAQAYESRFELKSPRE